MNTNRPVDRRDFLKTTLACTGSGLLAASPLARPAAAAAVAEDRTFEISLAQWSLHKRLFGQEQPKLDHLDFARTAKSLGIEAVEYVNQFFKDKARDESYLAQMKKRAGDEGVKSLLIMVDGEGDLGNPDEKERLKAVENHHQWVVAAWYLGCHSIRVNAKSGGSYDEQLELAADGLRRLSEFGDTYGINVLVENHGGLSSDGEWLAGVMKKVDHPRCGTLPDFGNFRVSRREEYDRYKGVAELMPFAKAVSAKSHDFDDEGNETRTDYFKMMKIVLDAGYHGWVGIEYEGSGLNEIEGIRATKRLLERVRSGKSA
jgi:sugar phosphate isomerase/epimerase